MHTKAALADVCSRGSFADRVVKWQAQHGRHHLPWQATRDPYRVWLSEIMLQQTQVATVRTYFERFLQRFPDVKALAGGSLDEVLHLWSGMGYYSRARNLHRCAQQIVFAHAGVFPQTSAQLQTLAGVGPSTAAAIASICFNERVSILDGNVKRLLTRYLGFEADLSKSANERCLALKANALLPVDGAEQTMPTYTQALMDLGATVCVPKQPLCVACPLSDDCTARAQGQPERYPVKLRKIKRSALAIWMLWATSDDHRVWLSQRPIPGVWAGLYCFALFDSLASLQAALPEDYRSRLIALKSFKHVLTHQDLYLHPVRVELPSLCVPNSNGQWFTAEQVARLGMPAPVTKLLQGE